MDTQKTVQRPLFLEPGGGEHYHFLNHLATVKVAGGIEGQLSVVEFLAPKGFGPPLHRHNHEDELFVVLAGEIVLRTNDSENRCEEGGMALLPRGVPHGFQVLSEEARILNVTGSSGRPPQFDAMVAALGTPIAQPRLPSPVPIDPGQVAEVCAEHGIDVLGPPPPPLD
jgi:quercetin dioxygenase-like cupin family protein